jgi:hypothetical protein
MKRKKRRPPKPKPIRKLLRIQRVCFTCRRGIGTISLGNVYKIYQCTKCEYYHIAAENPRRCAGCHGFETLKYARDVSTKAVMADGYCDSCKNTYEVMDRLVAEGGVYWHCKNCGARGSLPKDDPVAKEIRARTKVTAPEPMGVDVGQDGCPVCNPEVQAERAQQKAAAMAERKKQEEANRKLQKEAEKKFAETQAKEDAMKADEVKGKKKTTTRKKTAKKKMAKKKTVAKKKTTQPAAQA